MTQHIPEPEIDTDQLIDRFGVDEDRADDRLEAALAVIYAMIETDSIDSDDDLQKWKAQKQQSIVLEYLLDDPEMPDWIDIRPGALSIECSWPDA